MTARVENVLYVLTDGSYIGRDHDTVVVSVNGERRAQVPFRQLEGVVVMAGAGVSPDILGGLAEAGVFVAFFTRRGRFLARVEGLPGGNVLLRRAQFRAADSNDASLSLARAMVVGKIASERRQIRRAGREDAGESAAALGATADRLAVLGRRALESAAMNELRGVEGAAAREYFTVFDRLLRVDGPEFRFTGRSRRPPGDRVNAMLSFGYALLLRDCAGALAGIGLDPAVGFLHEDRPGRLGLALDLMEELRVPVVDRLVLSLVNRRQVAAHDFVEREAGGWEMADSARRDFIACYQKAKKTPIQHPFLGQDATWGMVPHLQARLLARTLRGDLDVYPPFELK